MNTNRKTPIVVIESATPLIEAIYERRLFEAVRQARELRRSGYKGAALFEFLALLQFQTRNEVSLAHELVADLRPTDLYFYEDFGIPESSRLFKNAPWVLQQELPILIGKPGFNPSKRLELLCALERDFERARNYRKPEQFAAKFPYYQEHGLPASELQSWLGRLLTTIGDVRGAFSIVRDALDSDPDGPSARYSSHLLFAAIPPKSRLDLLVYSGGTVRSFGAAPVEHQGLLLKEFCGTSLRPTLIFQTAKPLSPVEFTDWEEGWTTKSQGPEFDSHFYDFLRKQGAEIQKPVSHCKVLPLLRKANI
jgi:hypothetical protein